MPMSIDCCPTNRFFSHSNPAPNLPESHIPGSHQTLFLILQTSVRQIHTWTIPAEPRPSRSSDLVPKSQEDQTTTKAEEIACMLNNNHSGTGEMSARAKDPA
ncbi:hypothetical protein Vi05172_g10834 [Venturia inaequalis]|nr:hypothetical protein Vi05172_g10834 [Venturia inaequalis]